jgi:hypothetical protein
MVLDELSPVNDSGSLKKLRFDVFGFFVKGNLNGTSKSTFILLYILSTGIGSHLEKNGWLTDIFKQAS